MCIRDRYIEVDSETVAVDTQNDLEKVNRLIAAKLEREKN